MQNTAYHGAEEERDTSLPCIALQGNFDGPAARAAMEAIRRQAHAGDVLLDFGKVNLFQDFALALLAQSLSQVPEIRLQTRGLHGHAARLLQYLRIDPHTLAPMTDEERLAPRSSARWNTDLDD